MRDVQDARGQHQAPATINGDGSQPPHGRAVTNPGGELVAHRNASAIGRRPQAISRRRFLRSAGAAAGSAALTGITGLPLAREAKAADKPVEILFMHIWG